MPIDSDLEEFILRTQILLQALEDVSQEFAKEVGELQAPSAGWARSENLLCRMKLVCISASDLLKQMESTRHEDMEGYNRLEGQLKILIDRLEMDAVNHFTKGEYQECLGTLNFLCLVKPNDRKLKEYLELSRSRVGEGDSLAADRQDKAVSPSAAAPSLQRHETTGLGASSWHPGPTKEGSFPGSQSPIGEEDIPETSQASAHSPLRVRLAEFKSRFRDLLNGQRIRRRDWVWGAVLLLTCAALLIGVRLGEHFLTRSYDHLGTKQADKGSASSSPLTGSHLPQALVTTSQKDISISAGQNPLHVRSTDQVSLEESAQALFDVGRLGAAIAMCNTILQEDPGNSFALDLKERIQEYYAQQPKLRQLKSTSNPPGSVVPNPVLERPPAVQSSLLPPGNAAGPSVGLPGNSRLGDVRNEPAVQKSAPDRLTLVTPWLQKAHSAMQSGHYVLPPLDSVVYSCRRALAIDPGNEEAVVLKRDSFVKALSQAKELTEKGNYDEAQNLYSLLNYLSKFETGIPWSNHELTQELQKLEFKAYPVIHEHTMGSCTGRLRINGYVVSFVPTLDNGEGFTEKLSRVTATALNDKLKLKVGEKNYRFRPNRGRNDAANQDNIKDMYGRLFLLPAGSN